MKQNPIKLHLVGKRQQGRKVKRKDKQMTHYTQSELNAIMEYKDIISRDSPRKKISYAYFPKDNDPWDNHKKAVHIIRYILRDIYHFTKEQILQMASREWIHELALDTPYAKLIFPDELSKKKDYFYLAKLVYPDEIVSLSEDQLIKYVYKQVTDPEKSMKFPANYFNQEKGRYRAMICLRKAIEWYGDFTSIEDLYEKFADEKYATKFLKKVQLLKPMSLYFKDPMEYLDWSLPDGQANGLLYFDYRFHQIFDDSEAGKIWEQGLVNKKKRRYRVERKDTEQ